MRDDRPPYVDGPHHNEDAQTFGGVIVAMVTVLAFYIITGAIIVICISILRGE